ncbi:hypothetical protein HMN09_00896200 [Mycena chlorophos]|uniref:Uncharacterized protein n=1 Tax=Mycena chlorophos TaxID=658473 RepID=A0A8H6SPN0_MYCCL|nr:hypothetical protein HMN09_00896200 [Mycena chlorophos]
MLIKLTPQVSATPSAAAPATPTILFALSFPDLPANLPLPHAWATQLARLAADDLEAPPSMHALDRAAALPSLLQEVVFDLPGGQVVCSFLDGKTEEWDMGDECREMLDRVVFDVEESGRVQRVADEEEDRLRRERMQREERERLEAERRASIEREREEATTTTLAKAKVKEQILNSPPASLKSGTRFTKSRLVRSRSLLMALVATFTPGPTSPPASSPPTSPTRSPSPLLKLTRRASSASRESREPSEEDRPPSTHDLETPPPSAPPSAPSSAFSQQQTDAPRPSTLRREELSPRLLRRRARSTLVDAFRAHVLPQLATAVGLFESNTPSFERTEDEDMDDILQPASGGGGYHAWVARSMLRRAEDRMRELEAQYPSLAETVSLQSQFSPNSIAFPISPRHATFEPWSSDESQSESEDDDQVPSVVGDGDSDSDSDGSSVHTPETGHTNIDVAIAGGHSVEASTDSNSSYFTCADEDLEAAEDDAVPPLTASHLRRPSEYSPVHSRHASGSAHPRVPSSSSSATRKEQRRAQKAAQAEHAAFVRMTTRLRSVLAQSSASRQLNAMQKDEADRVREGRGLRRARLDKRSGLKTAEMVQVFRPSQLGRWTWGVGDIAEDDRLPPAYEDVVLDTTNIEVPKPTVVSPTLGRRPRPSPPIQRTKTLDQLEVDVELEHLDTTVTVELEAIDIEVDLERLDLSDSLDVDSMGLDVDVDDVFSPAPKPRAKIPARRVPMLEGWERRRTLAI